MGDSFLKKSWFSKNAEKVVDLAIHTAQMPCMACGAETDQAYSFLYKTRGGGYTWEVPHRPVFNYVCIECWQANCDNSLMVDYMELWAGSVSFGEYIKILKGG